MSHNAIEKFLWLIGIDAGEAGRFKADPDAYLSRFALTADERAIARDLDVAALHRQKANPLLLLAAYRAVKGPDSIPDYMARMNAGHGASETAGA